EQGVGMKSIQANYPWSIQDRSRVGFGLIVGLTLVFILAGFLLQHIDPTAGVLDMGILTVLLFGLLAGITVIFCSLWLQEILWNPIQSFRKQFYLHFIQLTSWQQCILYLSVFFLWQYAMIWILCDIL